MNLRTIVLVITTALSLNACGTTSTVSPTTRSMNTVFQRHHALLAQGQTLNSGVALNGFFDTLRASCAMGPSECLQACSRRGEMRTYMQIWNNMSRSQRDSNGDWTQLTWDDDINPLCEAHGNP